MSFGKGGCRAQRKGDAVMFLEFRADTPEGVVCAEIRNDPLQRQRVASTADFGGLRKGALQPTIRFADIGLLYNDDFTEGAVPVKFFLPDGRR